MTNQEVITQYCEYICGYNTKAKGHNSTWSIFYEKDIIYSYGYHWPMAWYQGARDIIVNSSKYSVTTSKHMSMLMRELENYCVNEFTSMTVAELKESLKK